MKEYPKIAGVIVIKLMVDQEQGWCMAMQHVYTKDVAAHAGLMMHVPHIDGYKEFILYCLKDNCSTRTILKERFASTCTYMSWCLFKLE